MGCLFLLVSSVGVLVGLVVLPTITAVTGSIVVSWPLMQSIVNLMPFGFLMLTILGGIWALFKIKQ